MSRAGDRYLRITNDNDNENVNHKKVDCSGGVQSDRLTSTLDWKFVLKFLRISRTIDLNLTLFFYFWTAVSP